MECFIYFVQLQYMKNQQIIELEKNEKTMNEKEMQKVIDVLRADLKFEGYNEVAVDEICTGAMAILLSFLMTQSPIDDPRFIRCLEMVTTILKVLSKEKKH